MYKLKMWLITVIHKNPWGIPRSGLVFRCHSCWGPKERGLINVSMGCPILLPFFLGNICASTDIIQGQPLQWPQFLPKSAWHLRVGAFHWREHWTRNPVFGETWTSGPNSMANQLCDLQGSITMIHQHVFIILFPYWVLGIISTAFSALHTLSLIPQQPWSLLISLHPVPSLSGPKLPDTCQEPHTHKHTLTDTHTDSVSCISGSSAASTVPLIFQFSGICIHLRAAFELFHSSSWSQADVSSFPIRPEEGKGLSSSE